MPDYLVTWECEIPDTANPGAAAWEALDYIRTGTATVFRVEDTATREAWEIDPDAEPLPSEPRTR